MSQRLQEDYTSRLTENSRRRALVPLFLLAFTAPLRTMAQESLLIDERSLAEEITVAGEMVSLPLSLESDSALLYDLLQTLNWEDPETELEAEFSELLRQMIRHERSKFGNTNRVFWWHRLASRISFFVAHLFLLVGLFAGGAELWQAWRLRKAGRDVAAIELSIGLEGLALKTSLLGMVVVLVAFGFYALFLWHVYPLAGL